MTDTPANITELEEWLSRPTEAVEDALKSLEGNLMILGAGGKMGPTLARMARRALPEDRDVIAVSRFSSQATVAELESHGVTVIRCDLLDRTAVAELPAAPNVIFMAGQKFGTQDQPELTWMMNGVLPAIVAERYANSRLVVFSTGCVYPFAPVDSGGSRETDPVAPTGEYAWSCAARERVFTHFSKRNGTPLLIFRLNYAIDLRYGVLHDIATKVHRGQPVDVSMGYVNVIWQGDANARALQCLSHTASPPEILNVTGAETLSVRNLAERFGVLLEREPVITGEESATAWLSDASRSFDWFGTPAVSLEEMLQATAGWIARGGESLGKPTHFETRDGNY